MTDTGGLFDLSIPIIQAPMAGVSTPALAAAVCNAGGLGSLGIGASPLAEAHRMLEQARALTNRPFNVNVFCHQPAQRDPAREAAWLRHLAPLFAETGSHPPSALAEPYKTFLADDDAFRMLLAQRPAIVSFHFGIPSQERLAAIRDAGIRTVATATNPREAALIEQADRCHRGAGHRGRRPSRRLRPGGCG
ncbi:MAG: nitronate monooxygenase [Rhodospirillales bacterium]